MKKSGYRTILHIYLVFFLPLLFALLAAIGMFLMLITIQKPDGSPARSDWPKAFTDEFQEQIYFTDGQPQVKQTGLAQLQEYELGLQIFDDMGNEVYTYGAVEEGSSFVGYVDHQGAGYSYTLYFPMEIREITMYLNGERFTGGKPVILSMAGILLFVVLAAGVAYGFWTARIIGRLAASIRDISNRSYLPWNARGAFRDLYESLNALDLEIKAGDRLRDETDRMRQEWIANITHDLKTPLAPIKGYSELLLDDTPKSETMIRRYAAVMLKNAAHLEHLADDLKLTYQLDNGMVLVNRQKTNLVRFLKELVIDVLNHPEYENRRIQLESVETVIQFSFDGNLLKRAFENLIINAWVHGNPDTEILIQMTADGNEVKISITDNGNGMDEDELERLFERYYRGTDTQHKPEGTGLGLAIVRHIIQLHEGSISVSSIPGTGTSFLITFPGIQVDKIS